MRVKLSARYTAKAVLLFVLFHAVSAAWCGVLASAAEPVPAAPPFVTWGQGIQIAIGSGLIGFLYKLVKVLGELRSAGRTFVRESNILDAAEKKGSEIPQPLVTKKHEEAATKRALEDHIRTVKEMEAALRREVGGHMEKVSGEIGELRKADAHHAERLTDKIEKLTLIVLEMSQRK